MKIPVLANGDVFKPSDAPRILKYTGADMAMIGRGVFGNPWLFAQCRGSPGGAGDPTHAAAGGAVRHRRAAVRAVGGQQGGKDRLSGGQAALRLVLEGVPRGGTIRNRL